MEDIYNSELLTKSEPGFIEKLKSIFTKAPSKQLLYNIQFNALTIIVGLLFGSIISIFFISLEGILQGNRKFKLLSIFNLLFYNFVCFILSSFR